MNKKLKKFLHNFFKIFIIFLLVIAAINIVLGGCIYINHKSKIKKESVYMKAPGEFVNVNGHDMQVLQEGPDDADITIVFLHSGNVIDDSIALQPLFEQLKDEYHLVYVERSGVGFSEVSGVDRDIDTMLEETRQALALSGNEGPFVLAATGTAGIEAVHWANTYPDEVESIIGITMNYPAQFEATTTEDYCGFFDYIMIYFCKLGGMRLLESSLPDNSFGVYTDQQMLLRDALVCQVAYTSDMYYEDYATVDNAAKVAQEGIPENIKMYLVYANPLLEPYVSQDEDTSSTYNEALADDEKNGVEFDYVSAYNKSFRDYFQDYDNIIVEEMSGPARLYTYNPVGLADKIRTYLDSEISQ